MDEILKLQEMLKQIRPANKTAMAEAKHHWNSLGKPLGSLGDLEDAIVRVAGMTGDAGKIVLDKRAVIIFCADHGVVEEGVTQTGQEVTRIVAENFTRGISAVNTMAQMADVDVFPVDIGINTGHYENKELRPGVLADYKIARGTKNLAKEPAMTLDQCIQAILSGIQITGCLKQMGYQILVTGEMGIGNTTSASALSAVFLEKTAGEVTGRGAGLCDQDYQKKIEVVEKALQRLEQEKISKDNPLEVLAQVGGYEIAGMTGLCLGGALYHLPIVLDGVISVAAALAAFLLCSWSKDYMIASHESREPAGEQLLEKLGLRPFLICRMALGEGSGGVAVLPLIQMALHVYQSMATFEEIGVKAYEDYKK